MKAGTNLVDRISGKAINDLFSAAGTVTQVTAEPVAVVWLDRDGIERRLERHLTLTLVPYDTYMVSLACSLLVSRKTLTCTRTKPQTARRKSMTVRNLAECHPRTLTQIIQLRTLTLSTRWTSFFGVRRTRMIG